MITATGLNGFGRFGQHFLRYWIEQGRYDFTVNHINDPKLTLEQAFHLITTDQYFGDFFRRRVTLGQGKLIIKLKNGKHHKIIYTQCPDTVIPWVGVPDIFLECSGKNTDAANCQKFLKGRTQKVLISATSLNADALLLYGFNHQNLRPEQQIISYGSCTVNAFIPLANFVHKNYIVKDSDAYIIHNIPEYQMEHTLTRKACTLESVAPTLLDFADPDTFTVNYTIVPYTGVSMLDLRFRVSHAPSRETLIIHLIKAISDGGLRGLYKIQPKDNGPHPHKFTPYSAVIVGQNSKVVGDNIYIHAYFDNENSVNRFYDLTSYISKQRD